MNMSCLLPVIEWTIPHWCVRVNKYIVSSLLLLPTFYDRSNISIPFKNDVLCLLKLKFALQIDTQALSFELSL